MCINKKHWYCDGVWSGGHSCGTESLTCKIWCSLQIYSIRTELNTYGWRLENCYIVENPLSHTIHTHTNTHWNLVIRIILSSNSCHLKLYPSIMLMTLIQPNTWHCEESSISDIIWAILHLLIKPVIPDVSFCYRLSFKDIIWVSRDISICSWEWTQG